MLARTIPKKFKIASRARAPWRRSPHSSPGPGKPEAWRRGTGDPDGKNVEVLV
jgi:hypothetical protein